MTKRTWQQWEWCNKEEQAAFSEREGKSLVLLQLSKQCDGKALGKLSKPGHDVLLPA